ncbi:YxeA family protein [Paenibacillus sp. OAS669]|uniref:YxeA family protein n=1 Tax=Paenibacillus sp. OAS669 TaxID=2663821 RepID=UPI00178A6949|nr:YxeA family protein [Paenibacillus sp. OAS669]MBE1442936.1 uncharacterized protein (TIGR01655 family) [Paenibacillus sp. OAS669]
MKKAGAVLALIIVIVAIVFITSKDVIDRFNPLINKEYVYVRINQPAQDEDGRFRYNLTGYNAEGLKKKVSFTASTKLPEGAYVKVLAKGAYAQEWEQIKEEEAPKEIKQER